MQHAHTFLFTLVENRTKDMNVCIPHMFLLRSLRSVAIAVQIPGWWSSSFLYTLQLSLRVTKCVTTLSNVTFSSSIHWLHEHLSTSSTESVRNSGTGFLLLHKVKHSSLTVTVDCHHHSLHYIALVGFHVQMQLWLNNMYISCRVSLVTYLRYLPPQTQLLYSIALLFFL